MAIKIFICKDCNTEQKRLKLNKELKCKNCESLNLEETNKIDFQNSTTNFSKSNAEKIKIKIVEKLHQNIKEEYFKNL